MSSRFLLVVMGCTGPTSLTRRRHGLAGARFVVRRSVTLHCQSQHSLSVPMSDVDSKQLIRNRLSTGRASPLATYRELTVGDASLWRFIGWELLTMLIAPLPGGLGFVLRQKLYKSFFGRFGRSVIIGRNVTIRHPQRINIGDHVTIDDNSLIDGRGATDNGLTLADSVMVNRNCMVLAKSGDISIGARTTIGANSVVVSMSGVEIGDSVMFAGGCYLSAGAYRVDGAPGPIMDQSAFSDGPIYIGRGSWLGTGVIVLDGASVGENSVVGAGAVVVKSLPANCIALGSPAKVYRERRDTPATQGGDTQTDVQ